MPELPEVETVVRALRGPLIGSRFSAVDCAWPRHIAQPGLSEFRRRLVGRQVMAIDRRAKYLVFALSEAEFLIIHLKMTGHLSVVPASEPPDKHSHTRFGLEDGREMRFRDPRKFGRVYLTRDPDEVLGTLGPEPLAAAFTAGRLEERLAGRRRAIKPLLLDQTIIAGIGNIYADEALFAAGIHPERPANSLQAQELVDLHGAIREVLRLGIAREGASIDSYVLPNGQKGDMQNAVAVFRRTGFACFVCGQPIERRIVGGRSTHFCPTCQPPPD